MSSSTPPGMPPEPGDGAADEEDRVGNLYLNTDFFKKGVLVYLYYSFWP